MTSASNVRNDRRTGMIAVDLGIGTIILWFLWTLKSGMIWFFDRKISRKKYVPRELYQGKCTYDSY